MSVVKKGGRGRIYIYNQRGGEREREKKNICVYINK